MFGSLPGLTNYMVVGPTVILCIYNISQLTQECLMLD